MPESALQIICVDQFPAAEKFFAEPYHNYVNGNIENSFPFTHVEKGLVGDRYLEFLTYVPSDADYASQVPWSLDRSLFWWLKPDGSMAKRTRPLERRPPDGIVAAYSKVLVFCPEGVSGGHEALHQLRYVLWKQGGRAKLIYGGPNSNIDVHDNCVHCSVGQGFIPIQRFAHYHPQITEEEPIDEQTLIIYPEIMCLSALHSLSTQVRYKKAIWWLSVDNAIATNRELTELSWKDRLFSDPNIVHFYQSEYARKFLEDGGANTIIPLYDYTSVEVANRFVPKKFMFRERKPEGIVSFFPQKGGDLAARFLSYFDVNSLISHRGIPVRFQAIENMSKMEVVNALEDCDIYIDFGINPGKDRVPREAAALGCVVLLREAGAGKFYQDHPLAPEYKFRTEDIENGSLMARIFNLLIDWQWHFEAQAAYRERIQHEEAIFSLQVSEFFFRSNF